MANPTPRLRYQVTEEIFDPKSMLDEDNFYSQRQGHPSELTRKLTYILGDYNKNYPISLMTLGGIGYEGNALKRAAVELDDPQYTYPVMGRLSKASIVVKTDYNASSQAGIGNQPFFLYFNDNWIKRFFFIHSAKGIRAYVLQDPEYVGGYWQYKCQMDPALPGDYVPFSEVNEGAAWIALHTGVSESRSRSTETGMVMPGSYKNQMGFMRAGMSWAGNAAEKVMKINVKTDKGETDVWMDYFMWQFEMEWLSQCEHAYWYSRYNRQANGEVLLKDVATGKIVPQGSGMLEQIQNKSSYSTLTYDFLTNQIGDALFGQSDTSNMSITLHTGRGGMRSFDTAIKAAGGTILQNIQAVIGDKFITGTGYHLALGGYFDQMYHIDGYYIKVKHNPIFDMGKVAMAQQAGGYIHPLTGWPLESYRMVFIDDADYDGQPNIQHVAQKGRSFLHGIIPGLTKMPRSLQVMNSSFNIDSETHAAMLATDIDESSYTRFKSAGIQILRANRCFDLECIAGQ